MADAHAPEPRLSVVIPLYNKARHIARALDSVLSQQGPSFEVLVINDGSTDGGEQAVAARRDARLRLVNQPNQGVSSARNNGVGLARAAHIAFLDADDAWLPGFLATVDRMIARWPDAALYAAAYDTVEADGRKPRSSAARLKLGKAPVQIDYLDCLAKDVYPFCSSSVCVSREAFDACGGFDPALQIGDDVALWLRLSVRGPACFSAEPGATYFRDADNRAMDQAGRALKEITYFRRLVADFSTAQLSARQAANFRRLISYNVYRTARRLYRHGEYSLARDLVAEFSAFIEARHAIKLAGRRLAAALGPRQLNRSKA